MTTHLVLVVVLGLTTAACRSRSPEPVDHPRLLFGPQPVHAGLGFESRPNTPFTVGDLVTCLDRPGQVIVRRIDSYEPFGGLRLDAFAVTPNVMERGLPGFENDNRTIVEHGISTSGPVVIDQECPDFEHLSPSIDRTPRSVALLLQYSSSATGATAGNHGIVIHYESGGHEYDQLVDWEITLCAVEDRTTTGCRSG